MMKKLLTASFVFALILISSGRAYACMQCECVIIDENGTYCGPCPFQTYDGSIKASSVDKIEVSFPAKNRAVIMVPGYTTTHLAPGGE